MKEVWKPLPPFTKTHNGVTIKYDVSGRYMISNHGNLRSIDRKDSIGRKVKARELKPRLKPNGYLDVNLSKDGKQLKYLVHRLVAQTFLENTDNKKTVNHKNGDKTDNRVDNLEWATLSEQHKHAYTNGLRVAPKGEQSVRAKLTEAKVKEIRDRYDNGCTQTKLAKEYGVGITTIHGVIHRKLWAHI